MSRKFSNLKLEVAKEADQKASVTIKTDLVLDSHKVNLFEKRPQKLVEPPVI